MRGLLTILASCAALIAVPAQTWAQAKTAKACTEEWRADKANFQAKGITEKAYVAQCRAGAATTTAAPSASPIVPPPTATTTGVGQQKTAKACIEEWRADKANFQARGITEKAYVAQCRSGIVTTAAPSPSAPTAPAPAPPRSTAAAPAQPPAPPPERVPSTGSPSAAGQFATEAQAKAACPADTVVWVNLHSKIYHYAGTHSYGNTLNGAYMCERDTAVQGMRAAKNEQHP